MRQRRAILIWWMVLVGAMDQAVGFWARKTLSFYPRPIWGRHLTLVLLYNRGAMLGLGSSHATLIAVLGVVGTLGLVIAALLVRQGKWALATMAGGALGNAISRVFFSRVTDYIHVQGYPGVFNVSDMALRGGLLWFIALLVVQELSLRRGQPKPKSVALKP